MIIVQLEQLPGVGASSQGLAPRLDLTMVGRPIVPLLPCFLDLG